MLTAVGRKSDNPPMSKDAETTTEAAQRGFHWLLALPMSLWCLLWLVVNAMNYVHLTWRIFADLKWLSFLLIISPCFWIWLSFFGSSVWAPLNLFLLPWGKRDQEISRAKIAALVLLVPMLLGLALIYIGPYFYPVTSQGIGTPLALRLIPVLGGKGYD
jgi:hypothetical protein